MKKSICLILFILTLFSIAKPVAFADNNENYSIEYDGISSEQCVNAVNTLKTVFKNSFNIDFVSPTINNKNIIISLSGEKSDWHIKYVDGDVILSGGSVDSLEYAVNKFLEETLIISDGKPVFSSRLDYSYCGKNGTDNSNLLSYKSGKDVKLFPSYSNGILLTPNWVDSLVMVELRPDTASIGGTLPECKDLIDFYATVGVNGIWLAPIYDRGENGNGYSNYGPHTLEPLITGTDDYTEGWKTVKDFVDYAHSKGVYIFLDIITWGTVFDSPLVTEHPDWFDGEDWGNAKFNWENKELYNWFVDTAVNNILKTGADGYRCDCEPNYTGYKMYGKIRQLLKEKGKNIIIIGEDTNKRSSVYDFEQDGVLDYSVTDRGTLYSSPINFFGDGIVNIVDSARHGKGIGYSGWQNNSLLRGTGKYYINCITNHDYQKRDVCASQINIGYSAILAPYIPLWYMGDEFNVTNADGVQYFNFVDYSEATDTDNALFLESVKKMINIRRAYSDIFECWPTNHRNSNICKVKTDGLGTLQSYARYSGNKAVLVIADNNEKSTVGNVTIPFAESHINGFKTYKLTDLTTGKLLFEGTKSDIQNFKTYIANQQIGIYLVEGIGEKSFALNFDFNMIADKIYTEILTVLSKIK